MTTPGHPGPGDELDGLLTDLFEQGLTDEGWQALRQQLKDPERRRRYRRYVHMHAILDAELHQPLQQVYADAGGGGSALPSPSQPSPTSPTSPSTPIAPPTDPIPFATMRPPATTLGRVRNLSWRWAAAAFLMAAVSAGVWILLPAGKTSDATFATVTSTEAMVAAPWRAGARLERGPVVIPSGLLHVAYDSGIVLSVRGPARLALTSPQALTLDDGALVAHVPANAIGFGVTTQEAHIVDLGTEFGIAVSTQGHTDVLVRQGRIALTAADTNAPIIVDAGAARRIERSGTVSTISADATLFSFSPTAASATLRWQEAIRQLRQDPDLVALYDANGGAETQTVVANSAPAGVASSGAISGAHVAGPLPGSTAWYFNAPGNGIRIALPGRYRAISLLAWVKVDQFGPGPMALLTTDGWGVPPLFQWQCQPNGIMTLSLCSSTPRIWSWHAEQPLPRATGLWHLLGCAIENDGTARFYSDGLLLGENRHHIILDTAIGSALIGDWASYAHDQAQPPSTHQLRGALDCFAILARAMTTGEMVVLAAAGKP